MGGGHDPHDTGQLDPLLRELLDFGIAERDPTDGTWRLAAVAQQRLSQLASPPPPVEKIVYFGHRCISCDQVRPTRLRAEGLVCDDCAGTRGVAARGWSPAMGDPALPDPALPGPTPTSLTA